MPTQTNKSVLARVLIENLVLTNTLRVDRAAGIIYGVKVLGLESVNGRVYTREAVRRAAPLYEGRPVNIDHTVKADEQRSAYDRLGKLVNVRVESDGSLRADLHILKSHPMADRVMEAAERMPDAFGMSHNVMGRGRREKGVLVISQIDEVKSVDLVADPATTKSLREGTMPKNRESDVVVDEKLAEQDESSPVVESTDPLGAGFEAKILEVFRGDLDAQGKLSMFKGLLRAQEKVANMGKGVAASEQMDDEEDDEDEDDMEESRKAKKSASQGKELKEKLARYERQEKALELCEAAGITPTKVLRMALASAKDEAEMKALIKDHQRTARPWSRPRSQGQVRVQESGARQVTDGKSFAAAITRRA